MAKKSKDPRKRPASPSPEGPTEYTMMSVTGAGRSKPGAPTKNARKSQPPWLGDTANEITMMGKGKKNK